MIFKTQLRRKKAAGELAADRAGGHHPPRPAGGGPDRRRSAAAVGAGAGCRGASGRRLDGGRGRRRRDLDRRRGAGRAPRARGAAQPAAHRAGSRTGAREAQAGARAGARQPLSAAPDGQEHPAGARRRRPRPDHPLPRRSRRADPRILRRSAPGMRFSPPGGLRARSQDRGQAGGLPERRSLRQGFQSPLRGAAAELPRVPRPVVPRRRQGSSAGPGAAGAARLAGVSTVAPGTPCARCSIGLEATEKLQVFEDSSPICDCCAREQAPELVARLEAKGAA